MTTITTDPTVSDADRAEALFVSLLQPSQHPNMQQVREAITAVMEAYGCAGCAGAVAVEFGEHPDTAPRRMTWALDQVHQVPQAPVA